MAVVLLWPFRLISSLEPRPCLLADTTSDRSFPVEDRGLIIRSFRDGVFLLPTVFDGFTTGHTKLSFEHVGGKYFLSKVETQAGVYSFRLPRATTSLARMKNNLTLSSSGGN